MVSSIPFRYMGALNDFQMDIIIAFLFTAALYYLFVFDNIYLSSVLILLTFTAKEPAGIAIASFGLFIALFRKEKIFGLLLMLVGILGTVYLVKNIIPIFNGTGNYYFSDYYGQFGKSINEQALNILFHPLNTAKYIFTLSNLQYAILLFLPFAFIPLLSWPILFIGLLPFLQNILSNYGFQKDITAQYSYLLVPIIFFAFIASIKKLEDAGKWEGIRKKIIPIIVFVLVLSIISFFLLHLRNFIPTKHVFSAHKIMKMVPANASISASNNLIVHLQYREKLYRFPESTAADYILFEDIDRELPSGDDKTKVDFLIEKKNYAQIIWYVFMGIFSPREKYEEAISSVQTNPKYKLIAQENGIILYGKR